MDFLHNGLPNFKNPLKLGSVFFELFSIDIIFNHIVFQRNKYIKNTGNAVFTVILSI